jgi:hypothetical protein
VSGCLGHSSPSDAHESNGIGGVENSGASGGGKLTHGVTGDAEVTTQNFFRAKCGESHDSGGHNQWLRDRRIPNRVGITRGAVGDEINVAGVAERAQKIPGTGTFQPRLKEAGLL